ncbi:clustered mitochondria protein homolog [Boleophthalmus pectinirostris]|uniref:clustered mitochondria protein homolog n=1 Tax=Boleophthalmus pectinirostris TaxID=150288 RepID=UPI000A1C1CBD|nr:clustered mitochondria protein homolog [Boleophthalmus pectinirostris]
MKDKVRRGGGRSQAKNDDTSSTSTDLKKDEDTFSVKIQGAGVEQFELQVHGFWLVQDAIMTLLSRDEVFPRSNLSLSLAGATLDPVSQMQNLKGFKPGSILRLTEEPYTAHSARLHLSRVLELLRTSAPQDALREGRSPSILDTITQSHTQDTSLQNGKNLKRSLSNTKTEVTNQDNTPEYLLPGSHERPLMALLPNSSQPEAPSCVRDLSLSCWNPPPGHRKMQGDFLYITVVTIEGRHYDITSCPKGFFLNRSTEEVFDPRPAQSTPVCHCFTDLLCHLSPAFKQAFTILKNKFHLPPLEALPTPYHTLSWLGPPCSSRVHKNTFSRLGVDEQPAQAPDWNEELQAARDLPQGSLEERLQRDKALLQVNSAFVRAVTRGAENIIDGFVEPVNGNPEDPAFLWDGLFMSQGAASDVFGGERGRRAAQRLELKGVQSYSDIEGPKGLHTLPTAVVDYRGVRLSAQGLAPGIEGSEQDQEAPPASRGLLYGVNAGPQESPQRRRLLEHLAQAAKALSIQRHVIVSPKGNVVPLFTSIDAQGLVGADRRFYVLDVFRSFPADANFCPEADKEKEGVLAEDIDQENCQDEVKTAFWPDNYCSDTGFPKSFPHGLCRLRPELLQTFIQHKHNQFSQIVREKLDENGGFEECAAAGDSRSTNAVKEACKEVGSVSDIIFEMRFNPSIYAPGVKFPRTENASTNLQRRLLQEASAFIITHQIPAFVDYCLENNEVPVDGASLKKALHHKGINLRYLGHVVKAINQSEDKERLRHILRTAISEIFIRSTKRIFNSFVQGVDVSSLSAAVSHFLCCLLVPHYTPASIGDDMKKKSRRRGRGAGPSESTPWSTLTAAELWNMVCQDAAETYGISDILGTGPSHLVEQYGLQKLSLLREFCLKTGVQLRLKDYFLDNQNKAPLNPDDILNIFPVVKHLHMPIVDASKAFRTAQISLQKGLLDQAYEQLKEATYLYGRVCDDLHPEACYCHSVLARVAFLKGKSAEARSIQLKAVVISERVVGFDHPDTIQQYALLAVYMHAGGETALAQKCLLRARLLMLTVHGEDHPYTAALDSCLGLVMTGSQSEQYLKNALKLNISFFGATNLNTALSQHLLAQFMCSKGDYRSAMAHEKEALSAFTSMFGEDHAQTRCSTEFLGTITKQAVWVERSIRQAGPDCFEQTVECLTPTAETILEQMVLVTGIRKIVESDRFQEYKLKHKERKAAVAKEVIESLLSKASTSEKASKDEKQTINQEKESTNKAANSEDIEAEEKKASDNEPFGETNDVDSISSDTGDAGGSDSPTDEETKDKQEADGLNGEINEATETVANPSVLKAMTWADVVSKPVVANGPVGNVPVVNGGLEMAQNSEPEE